MRVSSWFYDSFTLSMGPKHRVLHRAARLMERLSGDSVDPSAGDCDIRRNDPDNRYAPAWLGHAQSPHIGRGGSAPYSEANWISDRSGLRHSDVGLQSRRILLQCVLSHKA